MTNLVFHEVSALFVILAVRVAVTNVVFHEVSVLLASITRDNSVLCGEGVTEGDFDCGTDLSGQYVYVIADPETYSLAIKEVKVYGELREEESQENGNYDIFSSWSG